MKHVSMWWLDQRQFGFLERFDSFPVLTLFGFYSLKMNTFFSKGILLICCIITPQALFAQLEQSTRLEIPANSFSPEQFEVVTLGDQGLITVISGDPYSNRGENWQFTKYDIDLKHVWHTSYKLDARYIPVMAYQSDFFGYWLFAEPDTDRFLFLQINFNDGAMDVHSGKLLSGVEVQHFKVLGSKAIIAGYYRSRPVVLVHSFFDHTTRVLPGLFEKNTELNNVDINNQDGYINVITYAYRKKNCHFEIKTYNYEGKLIRKNSLSDPKYSFISGQIVPLNPDESFLIGNYSVGCTAFSQGLYVTDLKEDNVINPTFIEFSELQNFFNYMRPKRKEKTLEKIGKRKSLGKENRFRYRLLVHDLIQTENEIILVAEVYYPNQRTTTSPIISGSFSRPYMGRTFDGFRYTHAIVCAFDKGGKLLWDNCITIKDLTSYDLQEMVQVTQVDDYLVLAYPQEGEIHTEVIRKNKVVVENEKFKIDTKLDGVKVLDDEDGYLLPWYGQYFVAYGSQRLGASSVGQGREVFYINKLNYKTDSIGKMVKPQLNQSRR